MSVQGEGVVRGWCPDAWHPMMAGDGLLVRVKPHLGQLSAARAIALCEAAMVHGNGVLDVTRRANIQLRGVSAETWPILLEQLRACHLVAHNGEEERRRNVLVAPGWRADDDTARIATHLCERMAEFPALPGKMGFVVDAGASLALAGEAGDFRIERARSGGLMLRADGRRTGVPIERGAEVDALIALAGWFVDSGGTTAGRMARHLAALPDWAGGDAPPAAASPRLTPGEHDVCVVYGLPFGRIDAALLLRLMQAPGVTGLRLTPWRMIAIEGGLLVDHRDLSTDPADPLLGVDACPGMPACPQASVETRMLARRLARGTTRGATGSLHVSGCGKGCARSAPADVVLTGRNGRYDLAFDTRAGGEPAFIGLDEAAILTRLGAS